MSDRRVTRETLGAWVIKCNPRRTPLEPMVAAGAAKASWCVAANYRSGLLAAGDRVLFWVSAHPQRGIWGAGRITGPAAPGSGRLHVPVAVALFDRPVTAATLTAVEPLRSMEVFRSPQQANPSWVSAAEMRILDPLLPVDAEPV